MSFFRKREISPLRESESWIAKQVTGAIDKARERTNLRVGQALKVDLYEMELEGYRVTVAARVERLL